MNLKSTGEMLDINSWLVERMSMVFGDVCLEHPEYQKCVESTQNCSMMLLQRLGLDNVCQSQ